MKKIALIFSTVAVIATANAQPAEVLKYHQDFGNRELLLVFCVFGEHICRTHRAIAYGQVCDSSLAEDMAAGHSGDVEWGIPRWPWHYTGLRCSATGKLHPKSESVFGGGNYMN